MVDFSKDLKRPDPAQCLTISTAIEHLTKLRDAAIAKGEMGEHEPVFILYGHDRLAVSSIFHWVGLAEKHGVNMLKVGGAWICAEKMAGWPSRRNPD